MYAVLFATLPTEVPSSAVGVTTGLILQGREEKRKGFHENGAGHSPC